MNIVVAPDSFKGSLTAVEATEAIVQGIRAVLPASEVVRLPLADGGEGTAQALVDATRGRFVRRKVLGPLREPVEAAFGILGDDVTAVIEMAAASGLSLVPPEQRNPMLTTTFGTGQLMLAALEEGCRKIIIGIGGSATNDGGAGMAQALGAKLLDDDGKQIGPGGAELRRLAKIVSSGLDSRLAGVEVLVASDVSNPLCGQEGASRVYGPQKGATPEMVEALDQALHQYASIIERDTGKSVAEVPGAGAAGGLGAGLLAFLDAKIRRGVSIVLEATSFEERLEAANLVLTGEGKIDQQTLYGKVVAGVGSVCKRWGVPVLAFAGTVALEPDELSSIGINAAFPIASGPMAESEAMAHAGELLQKACETVMHTLAVGVDLGRALRAVKEQ
jgi:glycerate kinase